MEDIELWEIGNERRKLRDNRTIILSGELYDNTAMETIQDLEILPLSDEPVRLIIASEGGEVFSGLAIMRAIKKAQQRGMRIIGEVHGQAMSMAFFVLQCCDERVMGKYDNLMCHGVTTVTIGDMKNIEAETKLLIKFRGDFAELVAERCTAEGSEYKEAGYWHAILEDNTPQFYDSKEALEMGLIDRVE